MSCKDLHRLAVIPRSWGFVGTSGSTDGASGHRDGQSAFQTGKFAKLTNSRPNSRSRSQKLFGYPPVRPHYAASNRLTMRRMAERAIACSLMGRRRAGNAGRKHFIAATILKRSGGGGGGGGGGGLR